MSQGQERELNGRHERGVSHEFMTPAAGSSGPEDGYESLERRVECQLKKLALEIPKQIRTSAENLSSSLCCLSNHVLLPANFP
jgi:hypothetical protein